MEAKHLEHGRIGEETACAWLLSKGHVLVARNVRYKMGEIDIITRDGHVLCFIEVRSREKTNFGTPQSSVRSDKQTKLIRAAQLYLQKNFMQPPFCRFDVVAVTGYGTQSKVEYFPNAFELNQAPRRRGGSPWQAY